MGFLVLSVLLLPTLVLGFDVDRGTTLNHQELTKRAFLNGAVQLCQDNAQKNGQTFTAPAEPYTVTKVAQACQATSAIKKLEKILKDIQNSNIKVDRSNLYTSPAHHFHNEQLNEGRDIVAVGLSAVKASNRKGNYQSAPKMLGRIFHTLQDFYSHSDWVEIGETTPNVNILKGNGNLGNIADVSTPTCDSCSDDCSNNIKDNIINNKILTTGYFAVPPSDTKPAGKCSHGGDRDGTSTADPTGGINKNNPSSSHGSLHETAANIAITATAGLMEDVRAAAGDTTFFQMIGANSGGKPLCFVIDISGSMQEEIDKVEDLTSTITSNSESQPSEYILVTFKDPDIGQVFRTTDSNEFKDKIESLRASAGGDAPEASFTGLQTALTEAPPGSSIFLFTDAGAKDADLKDNVLSLIEHKKSTVNVILTGHQQSLSTIQLYEEVVLASGGDFIKTTETDLGGISDILSDSYNPNSVILLHEARNPGTFETYSFQWDEPLNNVKVYITGAVENSEVTFTNPSSNPQTVTTVIKSSKTVGNFRRVELNKEVGLWQMRVESNNPYTVKVVGESQLDFIYNFMGPAQGPLGGLVALDGSPKAGGTGNVELTLIGSETATVTEAYLVELNGPEQVQGTVTSLGSHEYSLEFASMPTEAFSLLVKGTNDGLTTQSTTTTFQRLSSESIKTSSLSVTADELNCIIEPGQTLSVPFSVSSDNSGNYAIKATNDKGFVLTSPTQVAVASGSGDGNVQITASDSAESGTVVTLTIVAQAPNEDTNSAVLTFFVLEKVTDFTNPECQLVRQTSCSNDVNETCSSSTWELKVKVSDEGSGVGAVYLHQGNGQMTIQNANGNPNMVTYEASCCSADVVMNVVDKVGNVMVCSYSTTTNGTGTNGTSTTGNMSPKLVQSSFLCLIYSMVVILFIN